MMVKQSKRWCTLVCNDQFVVQNIINIHNLSLPLHQGDDLSSLISPHSLDRYFTFIMTMQQQKSIFLHELNIIDAEGHPHIMDFSCIRYDEHFLVIAFSKDMFLTNELSAINQELTNTLRLKMKTQKPAVEYMEELSGLNNELINTKRELVKKNVEISGLLEKEAALKYQLEETLRTKDMLFSILAHDLRSPLANVMSLMSLMNLDEDSCQEALDQGLFPQVHAATAGALRLLEDLLQWYRYSQSDEMIHGQTCNVKDVLDSVHSLNRKEAQKKGITLEIATDHSVPIYTDPNMLSTVLRNLLSNALKFTPAGGTITLAVSETEGFCKVSVVDTGVGMTDAQLNNLFNVQKNKSTLGLSGERGNGFGLVLVHDLVEKMGGTITAESTQGEGSRFILSLPQNEDE